MCCYQTFRDDKDKYTDASREGFLSKMSPFRFMDAFTDALWTDALVVTDSTDNPDSDAEIGGPEPSMSPLAS